MSDQRERGAVYVVEDDDAVRRSLALLLRSEGHQVESFTSAEVFLDALEHLRPGCVISDIRMPGMDGLQLQDELARRRTNLPVIIVTGHGDVPMAVRAMKAGAVEFVEKPYEEQRILDAVDKALSYAESEWGRLQERSAAQARLDLLSPREREVLHGLVEGRPNKVIAHDIGISPRTVEIHRANMMAKLGARSLSEAIQMALNATSGARPALVSTVPAKPDGVAGQS